LSSGLGLIWERGWVSYHEALDAGSGRCGTPIPNIRVPTGHDTVNL